MATEPGKTILITGGAGFIGSHTADLLISAGNRVRALDVLDPQIHGEGRARPAYLHPEVELVRGDVRNQGDLESALEGVDTVYHFASRTGVGQSMYDIKNYVETNCAGTAALIEAIIRSGRKLKRLVLSSSRAVYGEGTAECALHGRVYPHARRRRDLFAGRFAVRCPVCGSAARPTVTGEDRPPAPVSVYARTKLQQEEYCRYAAETFDLPVTILRYFNVYGSRQSLENPYTGVISIFYSRFLAGQPVSLYEQGLPGRDFIHVSDVAHANVLAGSADVEPGTCINIGSGVETSIGKVARKLAAACGRKAELLKTGQFRVGDIRACTADVTRAKEMLGFEPLTSLEAGLAEFSAWAATQESADFYQRAVEELSEHGLFGCADGATS